MKTHMKADVKAILKHFPKDDEICASMKKYVEDVIFQTERYIWVVDREDTQHGVCSYCRKDVVLPEKTGHNAAIRCPNCKSKVTVKRDWISHKYLQHGYYLHYYEKSRSNPKAIICRGIFVSKDFSVDPANVKTKYHVSAYYLFEPGRSVNIFKERRMYWKDKRSEERVFYDIRKSVFARDPNCCCYLPMESIEKAVKGTPFQYSQWEYYQNTKSYYSDFSAADGFVKFFDLYARYPSIEYITKLGLGHIVENRIYGRPHYGVLKFGGKNIEAVMRAKPNKRDINDILNYAGPISCEVLNLWQLAKQDKHEMSFPEIIKKTEERGIHADVTRIRFLHKYTSIEKILAYIEKQNDKKRIISRYCLSSTVLFDWVDYLKGCIELGRDLGKANTLFPRSLKRAHDNVIKQVKIKNDALLEQAAKNRLAALENKFSYFNKKFIVVIPKNTTDIINEGKNLDHCVGSYAGSHAKGKTNILFIRKKNAPDTSFFTMEVSTDERIMQVRGKHNCDITKEVQAFIDEFKKAKLEKPKKEGAKAA